MGKKTYNRAFNVDIAELHKTINLKVANAFTNPNNDVLPAGTPVLVSSNEVTDFLQVGTCYATATGTEIKFYKDNTFVVGATIVNSGNYTISSIDTSNDDYDVVTFDASATWTADNNYSDDTENYNAVVRSDINLEDKDSIPVNLGGYINPYYIPTNWRFIIDNKILSSEKFIIIESTATDRTKVYKQGTTGSSTSSTYFIIDNGSDYLQAKPVEDYEYDGDTIISLNISQSSTDDPTSTELKNNSGETVTLARTGTGVYTVTLSDSILSDDFELQYASMLTASGDYLAVEKTSDTVLTLKTFDSSDSATDGVLDSHNVKVRIYS